MKEVLVVFELASSRKNKAEIPFSYFAPTSALYRNKEKNTWGTLAIVTELFSKKRTYDRRINKLDF